MNGRTVAALVGFVILGLSPSFEDWKQSPQDRPKFVAFYAAGLILVYFGVLR